MTKEQIIEQMKKLQEALAVAEAQEEEEEVEDTRPLGEKLGSLIGKGASEAKKQGTSFWGGLKQELVKGGIIKPSKKKK